MKRVITICILLAQAAGFAADNQNAELLCVWNYKTQFKTISGQPSTAKIAFTEINAYYFFSDNTFVKAASGKTYDEVLKMKSESPKRWLTANNNLILLDENGKQVAGFVGKENQPVIHLLKGEKEITQVVTINPGTVSSAYNDVLAFFPK